jgi:hypothetical protein
VLRLYSIFQPPEDGLFAMPLTFYLSTTSLFQTFLRTSGGCARICSGFAASQRKFGAGKRFNQRFPNGFDLCIIP